MKKENLFKLWAYDAESKMWASGKDQIPEKSLEQIENIQKKTEEGKKNSQAPATYRSWAAFSRCSRSSF